VFRRGSAAMGCCGRDHWGFIHSDTRLAGPSVAVANVGVTLYKADFASACPELVFLISDAFGLRFQVCLKWCLWVSSDTLSLKCTHRNDRSAMGRG
jgi:hypothetical protein